MSLAVLRAALEPVSAPEAASATLPTKYHFQRIPARPSSSYELRANPARVDEALRACEDALRLGSELHKMYFFDAAEGRYPWEVLEIFPGCEIAVSVLAVCSRFPVFAPLAVLPDAARFILVEAFRPRVPPIIPLGADLEEVDRVARRRAKQAERTRLCRARQRAQAQAREWAEEEHSDESMHGTEESRVFGSGVVVTRAGSKRSAVVSQLE
jgi:hypothetical protein